MYKIEFAPAKKAEGSATGICPICKDDQSRPVLTVEADGHLPEELVLVECASCGTMYYLGDDPVVGYDFVGFAQDYWYSYVQNGAGITAMLEPLLAIGRSRERDLLDIGCGFGFVPDFWQRSGFGAAIGLETSSYGKIGREKLGVEIFPAYYNDAKEIAGRKFDYVFSSEVLEHVRDPHAFIQEISAALKSDGILVLTTPCADGISWETDTQTISAILSPGFHYFVTRPEALETLVRSCGFPHVLVRNAHNRLFCWASHVPLPQIAEGFHDWDIYFSYLEKLARNSDPHVSGGALYRQLKDAINLGLYDIAERVYPLFEATAKSAYGIDFRFPAGSSERVKSRQSVGTTEIPSWLGCGFLFAGRYLEHEKAPAEQLVALYSAAVEAMQEEIDLFSQFAQEAHHFLPMAQQHLSRAQAVTAVPAEILWQNHYPITSVRKAEASLFGKEVCLFVTYVPGDHLLPGAVAMIQALAASGLTVLVCCAVNDMQLSTDHTGLDGAAAVLKRRNGGYDFAVWAAVLAEMPEIWTAKRVVFINDSILGPLQGLDDLVGRIRASTADFVALTESYDIQHHSQSYFFVLQKDALSAFEIRNFWRRVRVEDTKIDVIRKYEVSLLQYVRDVARLDAEILFSFEFLFPEVDSAPLHKLNPTHHLWEHLVHCGFPFVKAELLNENPLGLNIAHWQPLVALHGGDVDMFKAHLAKMKETRGKPVQRRSHEKWTFLRRMAGDDLFFEISETWSKNRRVRR